MALPGRRRHPLAKPADRRVTIPARPVSSRSERRQTFSCTNSVNDCLLYYTFRIPANFWQEGTFGRVGNLKETIEEFICGPVKTIESTNTRRLLCRNQSDRRAGFSSNI